MKAVTLTPTQQTEIATLQATALTANASARAAQVALNTAMETIVGPPERGRYQRYKLSDDGTQIIVQP